MCGILAVLGDYRYKDIPEALRERGRDSEGMYQDEHVQLMQTRLHITGGDIDLPYQDSEYVLLFNGEIYNWKEFGHNEYQAILNAYRWGKIDRLDGQYAIIIYNKKKNLTDVYLDDMRIHTLYKTNYKGSTIYSSNLRSLPEFEFNKKQSRGYGNVTKCEVL